MTHLNCIYCDKPAIVTKYFAISIFKAVPNAYDLCKEHRDINLTFDDVYDVDGNRKTDNPWLNQELV